MRASVIQKNGGRENDRREVTFRHWYTREPETEKYMRRIDRKKEYVEIPPLVDVSVQDPSRKRGKNSGRTNTETRSTFEYKGQQKTNP